MNKLPISPNNNLSDGLYGTTQDTTLDQLMKHMSDWNHPFVFDISYALPIAPDKNNAVGIGERGMLHAFDYSGKHFYCIDSSKGWQESPYALKSDLNNVSNKLMLDGMKTLSVKWVGGNTMEFYVDNTRVFGISAKWDGNYS